MLRVVDLSFSYPKQNRRIIDSISYDFEVGKFYTIFGASGSGKSTFLSLLGGLLKPDTGQIHVADTQIFPREDDPSEIRRTLVSYIFQNFMLFPNLNAMDNIRLALDICHLPEHNQKVYETLQRLGIDSTMASRKVKTLSGGEQQRVAIARCLCCKTKYILADEPTGNLDKENTIKLLEILRSLAHESERCLIVVTHSELVRSASDCSLELDMGKLTDYTNRRITWK